MFYDLKKKILVKIIFVMKTKILIVADVLGEENNGTTITIKRLIDGLKKRDFDVYVLSPLSENKKEGYYSLKKRNFFIFNNYVQKNGVCLGVPNRTLLEELVKKVDIVHIELPFKTGKMAMQICKQQNKPFTAGFHCPAEAVTVHFGLKNVKFANDAIYKYHYKKFYKYCNLVHCPSKFYADILTEKGYTNNLKVISNGVSDIFYKAYPKHKSNLFKIITVGRLSIEKRQDLLLKAVANSKYNKNIQVIIAGDGPQKHKLQKLGKSLANPPIIKYIPSEELARTLHDCDLYVHCSDVEVEGMACLEALASGLVPIISDSPKSATKEFALSNHNLFENGSAKSLEKQIGFFVENPNQLKTFKQIYKDYARGFHVDNCIEQMSRMFYQAIKEHACNK